MKAFLTKCGKCNKKFLARVGNYLKKQVTRFIYGRNVEMTVEIPEYGLSGAKCPRCNSRHTKTLTRLNIEDENLIAKLKETGVACR